jgi:hypothetical protein
MINLFTFKLQITLCLFVLLSSPGTPSGLRQDDDNSVDKHLTDEIPGVVPAPEDDAELPGVDTDSDAKPTGVKVDSDYVPQVLAEVNGLGQQDTNVVPTEEPGAKPTSVLAVETQAPSPKKGMAACNARNRKQHENIQHQHIRKQVRCCTDSDCCIAEGK